MDLARRKFLQFTGAAVAAPAVGPILRAAAEPAFKTVAPLDIKREAVEEATNAKGAFFGDNDEASNGKGKSLLWRIRNGSPQDVAWQLNGVNVGVFRRPNRFAPFEIVFRCLVWSRGYSSLIAQGGGCYLEIVLSNKAGLTLNHLPLVLAGIDIRCQFKGYNLVLPSLTYAPVNDTIFDEISHIQLFDRGGNAHEGVPYIRALACGDS